MAARYHAIGIKQLPTAALQDRENLVTLMILLEHHPSSRTEAKALHDAFAAWFRKHPDHAMLRRALESMMERALREVKWIGSIRIDFMKDLDVETMGEKWERNAEIRGEARGLVEGKANLTLNLMRHKFGDLTGEIEAAVMSGNEQQLDEWGLRVLTASTPEDVLDTRH